MINMTPQPEPDHTEKTPEKDLKTFSRLPDETKELQILMEKEGKSIGEDKAKIHEKIEEKTE